jgi:hypothetical protein
MRECCGAAMWIQRRATRPVRSGRAGVLGLTFCK